MGERDEIEEVDQPAKKDWYQIVSCPFCNDTDYDLIGLKHHLQYFCQPYLVCPED